MHNFGELPDVVWVKILSYLSLKERSSVAQTCHALNDVFHHPSLWHTVSIILLAGGDRAARTTKVIMPTKYLVMIKKFGKYFQDLSLKFTGYMNTVPTEIEDVLDALSKECRLETLSLSVGTVLTKRDFYWERPQRLKIDVILCLIEHAFRLKTLNVTAWPMYRNIHSPSIMSALQNNKKIRNLENLNLFWIDAGKTTWATLNAVLPSPTETVKTLNMFTNLKNLKLRSAMLNDDVIRALAGSTRRPLESFSILVTYNRHDDENKLPGLSNDAWLELIAKSPELQVDFTVVTRVPFVELSGLFLPEIPVVAVSFMKYSDCQIIDMQSITDKYFATLKKFVDYSDGTGLDETLISMVHRCPNLKDLAYNGKIHHTTVIQMAKQKQQNWNHFQVNSENILTTEPQTADEDIIIQSNENGDGYSIVTPPERSQSTDEKEAVLKHMILEVASCLHQKWLPMDIMARDNWEEIQDSLYSDVWPAASATSNNK